MTYPHQSGNSILLKIVFFIILTTGMAYAGHAQGFLAFYPDSLYPQWVLSRPDGYDMIGVHSAPTGEQTWRTLGIRRDGLAAGNQFAAPGELDGFKYHVLYNGDFLATAFQQDDSVLVARRIDPAGNLLWQTEYSLGESNQASYSVELLNFSTILLSEDSTDGSIYLYHHFENEADLTLDGNLVKLSEEGQFLWSYVFDNNAFFAQDLEFFWVMPGKNGQSIVFRPNTNGTNLLTDDFTEVYVFDPSGLLIEENIAPPVFYNWWAFGFTGALPGDRYYMTHSTYSPVFEGPFTDIHIDIYQNDGQVLQQIPITETFFEAFDQDEYLTLNQVLPTSDGNFVLVLGNNIVTYSSPRRAFAKINPEGEILWLTETPQMNQNGSISWIGAREFPDGALGFWGIWLDDNFGRPFFVVLNSQGQLYPYTLAGHAARDLDGDCQINASDPSLASWLLECTDQDDNNWWVSTGVSGQWNIPVDTGEYTLNLIPDNYLWQICETPQVVSIPPDTGSTTIVDFAAQTIADCPFMRVSLGASPVVLGQNTTYIVHYCNEGTAQADQAAIWIDLSPELQIVNASWPYSVINDRLYFELGAVPTGFCGDISIVAAIENNPAWLDATVCMTAHITPDSICMPPGALWWGGILEASAECVGDSVRFDIKNIGVGEGAPGLDYVITDDHVIMFSGSIPPLQAGGTYTINFPQTGGSIRLIADQVPYAPHAENLSFPVLDCGAELGSPLIVLSSNQTGSPFSDMLCNLVTSDVPPVPVLSASPVGVGEQHIIEAGTVIEYSVHFTNNATSTTATITDTLSPLTNLAGFETGATSHTCFWHLGADGVLYMTLHNIAPDEACFVYFKWPTREDLPDGAQIRQRVGLQTPETPAIFTNEVFHTIGTPYTEVKTAESRPAPSNVLQISPNPTRSWSMVRIGHTPRPGAQIVVRNHLAQVVGVIGAETETVKLEIEDLPAGCYFVEYREGSQTRAFGKWIRQ